MIYMYVCKTEKRLILVHFELTLQCLLHKATSKCVCVCVCVCVRARACACILMFVLGCGGNKDITL
jgi:hypothetical protein